ncbi:hypothetical protein V3A08_13695, partial [Tenacibaculum maritimum]
SSNITDSKKNGDVFVVSSRFHEFNATDSKNLDNLIRFYKRDSSYVLYPAYINDKDQFTPDLTRGIEKKELIIKNAWEISINDMDSMVIREEDKIIIPENVKNAPVLEVLELIKNRSK